MVVMHAWSFVPVQQQQLLMLLQVLQGHSDDVTCVVLTSRARFVVTGSVDGTAQVWDLAADDVKSVDVHDGKVKHRLNNR
jgi:WD40 repeat protein